MLSFEIVTYSSDARSALLKLLKEVRQGNFEHVGSALKEAGENLTLVHSSQTRILTEEASGKEVEIGFIFIRGQDHLMTTLLLGDLIQDFIALYRQNQG